MSKCEICGKNTKRNYPLCTDCYNEYNNGEILRCEECGKFHYYNDVCSECGTYSNLPTEGFNTCILCGEYSLGYAFCKDCWKEYDDETLLDILNRYIRKEDIL